MGTGADARGPALLVFDRRPDIWRVRQILDDPAGDHDWGFDAEVEAVTALRLAVANLRAQSEFDLARVDTWSRNPVKRFLHRVMSKLTIRQTRGVLDQYKRHSDALDEVLASLIPMVESLVGSGTEGGGRDRSDLDKRLHTALDRIGLLEERLDRSLEASDDRSV